MHRVVIRSIRIKHFLKVMHSTFSQMYFHKHDLKFPTFHFHCHTPQRCHSRGQTVPVSTGLLIT